MRAEKDQLRVEGQNVEKPQPEEIEKDAWWDMFWEMIAEDARNGNVKDPKGKNVKGRRDKKTVASNLKDRIGLDMESRPSESKAAEEASAKPAKDETVRESMMAIGEAQNALNDLEMTLPSATSDDKVSGSSKLLDAVESTRMI